MERRAQNAMGKSAHFFRIQKRGLRPAVGQLDAALGGIAAGEDGVQLPVDDGQALPDGLRPGGHIPGREIGGAGQEAHRVLRRGRGVFQYHGDRRVLHVEVDAGADDDDQKNWQHR